MGLFELGERAPLFDAGALGPVYATACYLTILQFDNDALPIYRR